MALAIAAGALSPCHARAQGIADTRVGDRVLLVLHDSLRQGPFQRRRQDVIGAFVRATPDSVWIRPRGAAELAVARGAIARASVSTGASRWKSALLLGVGWGIGTAAAVWLDDADHAHDHRTRDVWIGAGVGAGAGLVVGTSLPFELWRRVKS